MMNNTVINCHHYNAEKSATAPPPYDHQTSALWLKPSVLDPTHQIHYNTNIYNTVQYSTAVYGNDYGGNRIRILSPGEETVVANCDLQDPSLLYFHQQQCSNEQGVNCQANDNNEITVIENNYSKLGIKQDGCIRPPKSMASESDEDDCDSKMGALNGIKLSENELEQISVRDLNKLLQGQERELISKVKAKRRTLKNRGYALKCRSRRVEIQQQLMIENKALRAEVHALRQQTADYQNARAELAYLRTEVCRLQQQAAAAAAVAVAEKQSEFLAPACQYAAAADTNPTTLNLAAAAAFDVVNRCLLSTTPQFRLTPAAAATQPEVIGGDTRPPSCWRETETAPPKLERREVEQKNDTASS